MIRSFEADQCWQTKVSFLCYVLRQGSIGMPPSLSMTQVVA